MMKVQCRIKFSRIPPIFRAIYGVDQFLLDVPLLRAHKKIFNFINNYLLNNYVSLIRLDK